MVRTLESRTLGFIYQVNTPECIKFPETDERQGVFNCAVIDSDTRYNFSKTNGEIPFPARIVIILEAEPTNNRPQEKILSAGRNILLILLTASRV